VWHQHHYGFSGSGPAHRIVTMQHQRLAECNRKDLYQLHLENHNQIQGAAHSNPLFLQATQSFHNQNMPGSNVCFLHKQNQLNQSDDVFSLRNIVFEADFCVVSL